MKYAYHGYDKSGKAITGVVEAANVDDAGEQARRKGVFVLRVEPANKSSAAAATAKRARRAAGLKQLRLLSGFTRQLAVLVSTGTPVVQSLEAVARQTADARWRAVIDDVRARVEQGSTLSEAMDAHPRCFDRVACSLVRAGEAGGQLPDLLNRLATLTRQTVKIRSALTGAMIYPTLLIAVAIGVLSIMIGFVLPRFEGLFKTLNVPLPPSTKALMEISTFVKSYWPLVITGVGALAFGLVAWLRSEAGTDLRDRAIVSLPQIGNVARGFATARLARLLGVLIESKVPLLDSLQLTRDATSSKLYTALLSRAEDAVTRGDNVSTIFAGSTLVTPAITEALRSGERTGRIGPVLLEVANFLDEDNEVVLKSVTSLIEPLILIALGVAVGFVALSMFLPLFDLTSATQGGPPPGAVSGAAP